MKIAIISTCYEKQIQLLYKRYSYLESLTHNNELEALLKHSASPFYYWIKYIKRRGFDVEICCIDLTLLNQKWAKSKSQPKHLSSEELFLERISSIRPDVLFVFSPFYYSELLKELKSKISSIKRLVAWYGASQGDEKTTFSSYDLILTNSKVFRDRLRNLGMNAEILQHSFEPNLYQEIYRSKKVLEHKRKNRLVFTGTLGLENPDHYSRKIHLEQLADSVGFDLFAEDVPYEKSNKQILLETRYNISSALINKLGKSAPSKLQKWGNPNNCPNFPQATSRNLVKSLSRAVYGREMLEKLLEYLICFNFHNSATGDCACNMRLFEATGMGCCLLTDHKSDIRSLFEPDVEVVTYKSLDEAISKAKFLLNNPKTTENIALAGQRKTFTEYTTEKQVEQLVFHINNLWN